MRAVIFDIDGTLSDPSHRLHHVKQKPINWDAFFDAMGDDPAHESIHWLCRFIGTSDLYAEDGLAILITTGRPETHRGHTEAWLDKHSIHYNELYMRGEGDHRPDTVVKKQMLDTIQAQGFEVILVIDDRQSVVDMWRANGLTCLQARKDEGVSDYTKFGLLTLMVGPSGAGKTTWLERLVGLHSLKPSQIVSSDGLREEICGDIRDQTQNDRVFDALHALVRTRISHGLPTVVDATNIRRKDRLAIVGLTRPEAEVRYIVIDRPMDEKVRDGGWRLNLPINLLAKHEQIFRSNLQDILKGDGQANVTVFDKRTP